MKRLVSFALFASILVPLALATACASSTVHEIKLAPAALLPAKIQSAPPSVREAYQFAIANPDALQNVPCYCGCGAIGHTSNYACYIKEVKAGGTFVFDDHALG